MGKCHLILATQRLLLSDNFEDVLSFVNLESQDGLLSAWLLLGVEVFA